MQTTPAMIAIAVPTVEKVLECTHHLGCSVLVIAGAKAHERLSGFDQAARMIQGRRSVGLPVWAPDGRTLAYVARIDRQLQLFVRGVDAAQSTRVTTQTTDGISVFWSRDGARIFFTRSGDGNLTSVSAGGGEPQVVMQAAPEA